MADLTIGEVGKVLRLNLKTIDKTVSPPATIPLNLTAVTSVQLLFRIASPNSQPNTSIVVRQMVIVDVLGGIVEYAFQLSDLIKPPDMSKFGVFRFAVKVMFEGDVEILYADDDGQLTIKDDSIL